VCSQWESRNTQPVGLPPFACTPLPSPTLNNFNMKIGISLCLFSCSFRTFHVPSDVILFPFSSSEYLNLPLDSIRYTTAHRSTHGIWRGILCRQCPCWVNAPMSAKHGNPFSAHISHWRICTFCPLATALKPRGRIFMKCPDVTHSLRFWGIMEWRQVRILATPAILTEIFS
jgi:hypothetical protein